MARLLKKLAICGVSALALGAAGTAAFAGPERIIDPSALTPSQRAEFWRSPLGDVGPFGEPTQGDCQWSRLQVPTAEGLRWIAIEECGSNRNN